MNRLEHPRALQVTIGWTLGLLWLGSAVHATESSLACPDWPTCYGSFFPEMVGGVFWEHLHRLVAGGLLVLFGASVWLLFREPPRFLWLRKAGLLGLGLLLVQSVLGGLTVLWGLPTAVSSSHLALAFLFLALNTAMATASGPGWDNAVGPVASSRRLLRLGAGGAVGLVFAQSLLGALVRHTDAGMACPDIPLCLGRWIPPLEHPLVALHFAHRVLGVFLLGVVLTVAHWAFRRGGTPRTRRLGVLAAGLVSAQVLVGFWSVGERLDPVPVSLHTLLAASLLATLTALLTLTWAPGPGPASGGEPVLGAGTRVAHDR